LGVDQNFSTNFGTVQQTTAIRWSIIRGTWFSPGLEKSNLASHHVPTTQSWIEILLGIWLDGKLCSNGGMFKLATRNKFNMAAAAILNFVFRA